MLHFNKGQARLARAVFLSTMDTWITESNSAYAAVPDALLWDAMHVEEASGDQLRQSGRTSHKTVKVGQLLHANFERASVDSVSARFANSLSANRRQFRRCMSN